jgi:hypothetical protein
MLATQRKDDNKQRKGITEQRRKELPRHWSIALQTWRSVAFAVFKASAL